MILRFRLFVSLNRFDIAYNGLFKIDIKRLKDYPAITQYLECSLRIEGFVNRLALIILDSLCLGFIDST